ncbi:hypothetical protein [Haloarcula halophila]|uniref:hypothetical protein n=1 Tax=Haloarcula TaxID=2237 RepID=UPI0023E3B044|nr:hypothetical protein [Halomicroarcula sp. DFY41]
MTVGADLRRSNVPVAVAFLLGLVAHAVDQLLFLRAGPIPILVAGPVVATLLFARVRPRTPPLQTVGLLLWGAAGSGIAVLLVYVQAVSMELPRPLSGTEMVLFDVGMFCWFVGVLAAGYAHAAGQRPDRAVALLAVLPILQAAYVLGLGVLVVLGVYA